MGRLVSVVLVTWNSAPYLRRCLEGLAGQTYRETELIVVDNASSDDSAAIVAAHATRVIRNDVNRGFSAAVNQAVAVARGEYVQLVNPDCFLTPDYIAMLVDALERAPGFGSATGKLVRARGFAIEPAEGIDSMGMRMTRSGRHLDIEEDGAGGEVFGVSGAAALYRMSFLRDTGGFDEDFFAYREDADLAWRGRLFGWRALCEPRAVAYHVRRVTPETRRALPPEINFHSVKNRFLLRLKNEGAYLALRNAPFELARDLVVLGAALTIERTSLPAFAWLWRNRKRIAGKRRAIQSRRVVTDRELARWFR
ncbi:MAG: glycosyltransferase family 2 protein [Acidobacteria bacterium]|nr:glycosyltransferase family 2 protein [Acidobacteriota bacterium]MBV9476524.1 glycosyltransferase family 2 protein [Acidobacteriota bacterium]